MEELYKALGKGPGNKLNSIARSGPQPSGVMEDLYYRRSDDSLQLLHSDRQPSRASPAQHVGYGHFDTLVRAPVRGVSPFANLRCVPQSDTRGADLRFNFGSSELEAEHKSWRPSGVPTPSVSKKDDPVGWLRRYILDCWDLISTSERASLLREYERAVGHIGPELEQRRFYGRGLAEWVKVPIEKVHMALPCNT